MSPVLLRREPVVNRHKAITASRLIVHAPSAAAAAAELNRLADTWPDANNILVGLSGTLPGEGLLDWRPPANAMIEIPAAGLDNPALQSCVASLDAAGVPLCLDGFAPGMTLPDRPHYRFILADARQHPEIGHAPGMTLAKGLRDHDEFAAAMECGYSGATGWFFLQGMPVSGKLNASHGQIVRVLNLVRNNAELKEVEAALKHDVTLSFKLLRYINSAGFGLATEIQSFKHAVTLLGYDKLNKWLSLLLVTASRDPAAPALMETAIARGRFMELVGREYVDKSQADNLFIVGAFSLLDVLLGTRMDVVLEQLTLPAEIGAALLQRGGRYGAFLDLALACEGEDFAALAARIEALKLDPAAVNRAQIEALIFADSLQFN